MSSRGWAAGRGRQPGRRAAIPRGLGWRRAGSMCGAIFELPQRRFFFPKDYYLGVLRLFLRMCRQQGVSSSGVGSRGWAAAGSAAAGSGETRGPGWRRAGRMYGAIFELPQRSFFFFSRTIFQPTISGALNFRLGADVSQNFHFIEGKLAPHCQFLQNVSITKKVS